MAAVDSSSLGVTGVAEIRQKRPAAPDCIGQAAWAGAGGARSGGGVHGNRLQNEAVYIEASNVTRNGDEYVIKITKPSLNKMLSASSYPDKVVPLESIAILGQLERIAQNGVYFKSEGDRKSRPQVAGYDHLETTVYIDNIPYVVDMRVRVEDEQSGGANRLYHFTPEAISVTRKNDGTTSTVGRRATNVHSSDAVPSFNSIISENPAGGNARSARNRAGVTAVGDEYLQQALEEAWNGADGPSVRGPQEDGIHTLEAVDRRPAGLYDGKKEVGIYGQQGAGPADIGTLYGGPVWENAQEADAGRVREDTQAPGALPAGETGAKSVADWAKGYVRKVGSDHPAEQAAVITRAYSPNVVVIADHALRKRRNNALATTSNGTVYISDAIPADLAEPIGYHEAVHAVRQRGDAEYLEFVENLGRYLDIGNQQMEGFLELISEGKAYQQKDFFDLSMEELDDLFDELNALVWGYHKVSPEHAREQFGGIFTNYEAYIEELDAIMERARQRNEVGQSGYRERPGISIERILEEGWRDEAPSVRGPEEDNLSFSLRKPISLDRANWGYGPGTEEGAFSEENQLPGRSGAKDFGSEAVPVKEGATFRTEIPEYTEAVNNSISRAGKYAVEQGAKRQGEYLILVDTRTGTWLYEEAGDEVSVGNTEAFRRFVREHPDGRFAYVHAHPSGRGLSLNDMAEFFGDDQFESMVAAGYNGKVYAVYGKRAKISAWQEIMRPSVDAALGEDLRRQLRDDTIDADYFKYELEHRRVQYLIDHYCSAWEAET